MDGRSAIVAGGESGIGRAIALRLEQEGADMTVADMGGIQLA
jgi:NAD(P)-dependent dehydrogenase (short-subunit alcohol dehydrogenase family)